MNVNPTDIQQIGEELAIKWEDGGESFISLEALRKECPCAGCKGEVDVMGKLHIGPKRPFTAASFRLRSLERIGGYAIKPVWGDGHSTGLYSFDYLKKITGSAL